MKYGLRNQKGNTEIDFLFSSREEIAEAVIWAHAHESEGTFHYEFIGSSLHARFQFELSEDAVLFVLKFK